MPGRIRDCGVLFQVLFFKPFLELRLGAWKRCSRRDIVTGIQQGYHKNSGQACEDFLGACHD